jgi:ABC-2 type transport system ATP-binding protein
MPLKYSRCSQLVFYQEISVNSSSCPSIEALDLQKSFGSAQAVKGVTFQVQPGEIFGFLGPNGAGKTTTIKMLIGLLRPTGGTARISGFDTQRQPLEAKQQVGYVPDKPSLPAKLSGREYLEYIAGLYQLHPAEARRRGEELLRAFGLAEQADDLVDGYSHGMRQKTALAGALLHNPKAFFLDEPTVGLDPRSARLIKDVLRQVTAHGAAVFLTTHIMEIAERLCDRIAIINKGEIAAIGTMAELRGASAASHWKICFWN